MTSIDDSLQNQKTDNQKPNYKHFTEFPHPITAFITVLDPQGQCCCNQALSMPWQSTRLRLFLTRATSWFVMVDVLMEPLLQAKEVMTSTSCERSGVPETAPVNGQPVPRRAWCTVLQKHTIRQRLCAPAAISRELMRNASQYSHLNEIRHRSQQ